MENEFDLNLIKKMMLRKYPSFGHIINNVNYKICDKQTRDKFGFDLDSAATDGKDIYINVDYMKQFNQSQQTFVLAHEVSHIALNHIMRGKDKDADLWNTATDAIIDANLEKDGLENTGDGPVIEDALNYDAEELYEKLLKEQQNKEKQNKNSQKNGNQSGGGNGQNSSKGHDQHNLWEKAREEAKNGENNDNENQKNISDKKTFNENEKEKVRRAEDVVNQIKQRGAGKGGKTQKATFGDVGEEKPILSWKKILKRTLEEENEVWGHKFSDKYNDFRARIEDVELDEQPEVEVILDVSGSIDMNLLKTFLKQVKTLLKNSKVKVGTFSDSFHGFVNIKKISDINNFVFSYGGGTNFNAASSAFSKRKDVNKICFTDGDDKGAEPIREKRKDIIWISFENKHFKPDNGKVIYVPRSEIEKFDQNAESKKLTAKNTQEELTF